MEIVLDTTICKFNHIVLCLVYIYIYTVNTRGRQTKQKHNTICVGHHYTETNTNNINKTRALLQTTGGKDEPNIVFFMWKS